MSVPSSPPPAERPPSVDALARSLADTGLPHPLLVATARLVATGLPDALARLLDPFERDAVLTRARALVDAACFPIDETGRRYPWPLV